MGTQLWQSFRTLRPGADVACLTEPPLGVYHSTPMCVDLEAIDESSFSSDDSCRSRSERVPMLLDGSGQPNFAVLDIDDKGSKGDVHGIATREQHDRVRSIDLLRGFSTLGMVLVHFMVFYGNEAAMESILYFSMSDILGNVGAAGFLVVSGMSHALAVEGRFRKALASGRPWTECDEFRSTWSRSLKLQGVELLMLALAWGPREMIKWNILTLQASSTLVLCVCRRLPSGVVAAFSACIALATPALRAWLEADLASAWGLGFRESPFMGKFAPGLVHDPVGCDLAVHWDFKSIWQSYLLTGIFPLFPWLMFPLVGHILGRRILANKLQHETAGIAVVGAMIIALGLGAASFSPRANVVTDYLSPLSFYPDSFTMVLIQVGVCLVVIPLLYRRYDVRNEASPPPAGSRRLGGEEPILHRVFYLTSRWALPIYFLHYVCLAWPLAAHYYLWDGTYPICGWMEAGSALLAGLVAVVFLLGLAASFENKCLTACLHHSKKIPETASPPSLEKPKA